LSSTPHSLRKLIEWKPDVAAVSLGNRPGDSSLAEETN